MIDRNKERYKKRMRQLILLYFVITLIFGIFLTILLMNAFSDKKKLREEGLAAFEKGDYTAAEASFKRSLDENQWFTKSMDLDTRMYLGACYLRQSRYEDAVTLYKEIEEKNNGSVNEDLLHSMKDMAEAMSEMENVKLVPPDDNKIHQLTEVAASQPYLYLCIASVYNDRGDAENAGKALESYLSVRPVNTYVAYELATAYINQNRTAEAADMIDKGLAATDGSFTDLLKYDQAVLKEMEGDFESAFSMLESLYKQYPDNASIKKEYDFLYSRLHVDEVPVNPYTDVMTEEEIARAKQAAAEAAAQEQTDGQEQTDEQTDGQEQTDEQ